MSRIIVITSGKGGVGKTTVAVNLGVKLAERGERVVLIDLDFGLNNLDVVLGVPQPPTFDLGDVVLNRCRPKQALRQVKGRPNLYFISSNSRSCNAAVSGERLKSIADGLSYGFDFVIIDCPAGIDSGFVRALSAADEAIIVVNPNPSSIKDAQTVIGLTETFDLTACYLVINRARGDLILSGSMPKEKEISETLGVKLLGVLPEEDTVMLSSGISGLPRHGQSDKAYTLLAKNLVSGKAEIFDVTGKYSGFWGSVKRILRRGV